MIIRIHMRMISSNPAFDRESFSLIFWYLRESFFEIRERCVSIWFHIDDREDDLICDPPIEELSIYLWSSADVYTPHP